MRKKKKGVETRGHRHEAIDGMGRPKDDDGRGPARQSSRKTDWASWSPWADQCADRRADYGVRCGRNDTEDRWKKPSDAGGGGKRYVNAMAGKGTPMQTKKKKRGPSRQPTRVEKKVIFQQPRSCARKKKRKRGKRNTAVDIGEKARDEYETRPWRLCPRKWWQPYSSGPREQTDQRAGAYVDCGERCGHRGSRRGAR